MVRSWRDASASGIEVKVVTSYSVSSIRKDLMLMRTISSSSTTKITGCLSVASIIQARSPPGSSAGASRSGSDEGCLLVVDNEDHGFSIECIHAQAGGF